MQDVGAGPIDSRVREWSNEDGAHHKTVFQAVSIKMWADPELVRMELEMFR